MILNRVGLPINPDFGKWLVKLRTMWRFKGVYNSFLRKLSALFAKGIMAVFV